jgi:outer membrane protein assembly factor BamB
VWTTRIAAPVAGLVPVAARKTIDVVTLQGRIFSLNSEQLAGGIVDRPSFSLPQGSIGSILPDLAVSPEGNTVVWTESQAGGRVFAYDASSGAAPLTAAPADSADQAAAGGVLWKGNVLVPRTSGKVELLSLATGNPAVLPFVPALSPDELPLWSRPAVLADGSGIVISDGRHMLYRVAPKDQPQPHLAAAVELEVEQPIRGPLVTIGDTVYGLIHADSSQTLAALNPQTLSQTGKWPLTGQPQFGPVAVQGRAYVATEADGLFCLGDGAKLLWQRPLAHGPLAGPPVSAAGELILLYQSGKLARVSAETGDELAAGDLGEPPGRVAAVVGQQLLVSTSDGALVLVPLPN